jgi:hypothetical protein
MVEKSPSKLYCFVRAEALLKFKSKSRASVDKHPFVLRLLLFTLLTSGLATTTLSSSYVAAASSLDEKTVTICTSLKTGFQTISKTGKCNERIYETRTWYKAGTAPIGTPGSQLINLNTCISKGSLTHVILTRKSCNSVTQITAQWQRPIGPAKAPSITSVVMGILGTATLVIAPPPEDGGARITSYLVTSFPGGLKATYTPAQIKAAQIKGLTPGTTYSFDAVAINSRGISPASVISAPNLAPDIPKAPSITNVVATGTGSVQLTFTAPASNGGSPITSYVATSNPQGLQTTVNQSSGGTMNINNLAFSTSYSFTLVAYNAAGPSPSSASSATVTTAAPPPEAPPTPPAVKVAITRDSVGTARRTAFTTQPQITIQDANSQTVTTSTAVVTATVSAGGTLVGTATATAASGIATFANLGVNGTIGSTYTITYTAVGLQTATATVTLAGTTCDGTSFTCQVGDTGPGGGKIFYVAPTTFTQLGAVGTMCSTSCKYLEAAPTSGTNAWTDATYAWSGNTTNAIGATAQGSVIGTGFANTLAMVGQGAGGADANKAGTIARAYRGPNNLTNWFLPSIGELAEVGNHISMLGISTLNAYWSSSEDVGQAGDANFGYFSAGLALTKAKSNSYLVRPIRAFGSITIATAAISGVTAPVIGATPVTTVTPGTGYTGTIAWSTSPATFAAATSYTATITLTPTSEYTLLGVSANFFTVAGALTVTHSADAGVITAVFPTTGPAAKLAITRASVGTAHASAFTTQPQITIQDANGNTITTSTAVVTATISAGGTLVGTTTATASAGVATFTNLGVEGTRGTTYTVTYSVTGLTAATASITPTNTICDGTTFTCQIGDTGPGGGIIFYVAAGTFTQLGATGGMCTNTCKYLEAAPTAGTNAWTDNAYVWSGNLDTVVTSGTGIGTGYQNTVNMVTQSNTANRAGTVSQAYRGPNNLTDWFLPSQDELNQLCKWQRASGTDRCDSGVGLNRGINASGFVDNGDITLYWSSTNLVDFNMGAQGQVLARFCFINAECVASRGAQGARNKSDAWYVRPIRAF